VKVPVEAVELTVTVRTDWAEPPLGGVTTLGLKLYVIPLGAVPVHDPDKVTAELKPLIDVTVMVEVVDVEPDVGRLKESDVGLAEMPKSGVLVTVSVNWVVCVFPPPVPVTVMVDEPVGVEDEVLTVKVLVKVGLPDAGLKLHDAPEGRPLVQDRLTDCDCPPVNVTVIVLEPEPP